MGRLARQQIKAALSDTEYTIAVDLAIAVNQRARRRERLRPGSVRLPQAAASYSSDRGIRCSDVVCAVTNMFVVPQPS